MSPIRATSKTPVFDAALSTARLTRQQNQESFDNFVNEASDFRDDLVEDIDTLSRRGAESARKFLNEKRANFRSRSADAIGGIKNRTLRNAVLSTQQKSRQLYNSTAGARQSVNQFLDNTKNNLAVIADRGLPRVVPKVKATAKAVINNKRVQQAATARGYGSYVKAYKAGKKIFSDKAPAIRPKFGVSSASQELNISPLDIKRDLTLGDTGGIGLNVTTPGIQISMEKEFPLGPPLMAGPIPIARMVGFLGGGVNAAFKFSYEYRPVGGTLAATDIVASMPIALNLEGGFRGKFLEGIGTLDVGLNVNFSFDAFDLPEKGTSTPIALKVNVVGTASTAFPQRTFPIAEQPLVTASNFVDSKSYVYNPILAEAKRFLTGAALSTDSSGQDDGSEAVSYAGWSTGGLPSQEVLDAASDLSVSLDSESGLSQTIDESALPLQVSDDPFTYIGSNTTPIEYNVALGEIDDQARLRFHQVDTGDASHAITVLADDPSQTLSAVLVDDNGTVLDVQSGTGTQTISLENVPAGSYGIVSYFIDGSTGLIAFQVNGPSTSLPDLVADLHPIGDVVYVDQKSAATFTITNAGTAASEPTKARLMLSRDTTIDVSDAVLGVPVIIPSLAPGERAEFTVPWQVPENADYSAIGVWVDRFEETSQSSTFNDVAASRVEIRLPADVFEPSDSPEDAVFVLRPVPGTILPGMTLEDRTDDDFYLFYHDGSDGQIVVQSSRDDLAPSIALLDINAVPIAGRSILEQEERSQNVLSLEDLPAGEYYIHLYSESPLAYNLEFDVAPLPTQPNLVALDLRDGVTLTPEIEIDYSATLANFGSAGGPVKVIGELLVDDVIVDTSELELPAMQHNDLFEIDLPVRVPASAAGESLVYRIRTLTSDLEGNQVEQSTQVLLAAGETVDTFELTEIEEGSVDLGVLRGNGSQSGMRLGDPGDVDYFQFQTVSEGANSFLEINGDATRIDAVLYDQEGTAIAPRLVGSRLRFDFPTAGEHLLRISSTELSGEESLAYGLTWVTPTADGANLRVDAAAESFVVGAGEDLRLAVRLENNGNQISSPTSLSVRLSDDDAISVLEDPAAVSGFAVPAIEPGGVTFVSVDVPIPADHSVGQGYYAVFLDSFAGETSSADNMTETLLLTVEPGEDALEPNSDPTSPTIVPGDQEVVTLEDLTLGGGDVDLFGFSLADEGDFNDAVVIDYSSAEGPLLLSLYDDSGNLIRGAEEVAGSSVVALGGLLPGNYLVEVRGKTEWVTSSDYSIEFSRAFAPSLPLIVDRNADIGGGNDRPPVGGDGQISERLSEHLDAHFQAALQRWESVSDVPLPDMEVTQDDLPAGYLGLAEITQWSGDGQPVRGKITVDTDADGHGWWIDSTPGEDSEFTRTYGEGQALGRPGETRYDLLTLLMHEVGHLAGFTDSFGGFASLIVTSDGISRIATDQGDVLLTGDRDHVTTGSRPFDLMNPTLRPGIRKLPSMMNAEVLNRAHGTNLNENGDSGQLPLQSQPGFISLSVTLDESGDNRDHIGLRNADLQITDPQDQAFGWRTVGEVRVVDGTATIGETAGLIGDLSQSFVIPGNANELSFTIGEFDLDLANGPFPSEAFEVSLLGIDLQSLTGSIPELQGSDALLNIQADGLVSLAPGVRIEGVESGDTLNLSQPIDVRLELPAELAGRTASLYFDLIGFGDDDSSVDIRNIRLTTDLPRSWQNPINRFDVNDGGQVSPLDALVVMNQLGLPTVHTRKSGQLFDITESIGPPQFYDVNGDGRITPLDALQVINHLARTEGSSNAPQGEGVESQRSSLLRSGSVVTDSLPMTWTHSADVIADHHLAVAPEVVQDQPERTRSAGRVLREETAVEFDLGLPESLANEVSREPNAVDQAIDLLFAEGLDF
ncbi:MAG: CARDB domain-containing protein [Planctomycetota bacterium]